MKIAACILSALYLLGMAAMAIAYMTAPHLDEEMRKVNEEDAS